MQPDKRQQLSDSPLGQMQEEVETIKSCIRGKVEHPFHVVKNLFATARRVTAAWPTATFAYTACSD